VGAATGHVLARVERRGDAAHGAAFAGGVDAFEDEDQRSLREALVARVPGELALILFEIVVVTPCGERLREIELADQPDVVDDGRRGRRDRAHGRPRALRSDDAPHRVEQDAADGEAAVMVVGAFDDAPRRFAARGFAQHVLPQRVRLAVKPPRFPVAARDAPAGARVLLQALEACLLVLPRKMDPELEQHEPFLDEHPLVVADRLELQLEPLFAAQAGKMRGERLVVPGVHEDADTAFGRQRAPVAPRQRPHELVAAARAERDDADVPRIHPLGELVRGLAAPAALDPRDNEKHRTRDRTTQAPLRGEKRLAQLRLLALVLRLRYPVADFGRFEHPLLASVTPRSASPARSAAMPPRCPARERPPAPQPNPGRPRSRRRTACRPDRRRRGARWRCR